MPSTSTRMQFFPCIIRRYQEPFLSFRVKPGPSPVVCQRMHCVRPRNAENLLRRLQPFLDCADAGCFAAPVQTTCSTNRNFGECEIIELSRNASNDNLLRLIEHHHAADSQTAPQHGETVVNVAQTNAPRDE